MSVWRENPNRRTFDHVGTFVREEKDGVTVAATGPNGVRYTVEPPWWKRYAPALAVVGVLGAAVLIRRARG